MFEGMQPVFHLLNKFCCVIDNLLTRTANSIDKRKNIY